MLQPAHALGTVGELGQQPITGPAAIGRAAQRPDVQKRQTSCLARTTKPTSCNLVLFLSPLQPRWILVLLRPRWGRALSYALRSFSSPSSRSARRRRCSIRARVDGGRPASSSISQGDPETSQERRGDSGNWFGRRSRCVSSSSSFCERQTLNCSLSYPQDV